jgi:hypothetical protein
MPVLMIAQIVLALILLLVLLSYLLPLIHEPPLLR